MTLSESEVTRVVGYMAEVSKADTVYRDIYLSRASVLLARIFSEASYRQADSERRHLEDVLRQVHSAVRHQAWPRVQSLLGRARTLKRDVDTTRPMLELAAKIYDPGEIPLDPFSPALASVTKRSLRACAQLRHRVVTALDALQRDDRDYGGFYSARGSYFQAMRLDGQEFPESSPVLDASALEDEATRALERGDLDRVDTIAREVLGVRPETPALVDCPPVGTTVDLSRSFPPEAEERARKLGLRAAYAPLDGECADYLNCCCVWQQSIPTQPLGLDTRTIHSCACNRACPPGITASLKDTLDLLIVHPFVSSAGERYLPRFTKELVLVEDFPEDVAYAGGGDVLGMLGLTRRHAVSRIELERRLLHHGAHILEHALRLPTRDFRLVCIPFDIYSRLAPAFGWGQQPRWTHFDGYQVWKEGRLRALVGGDVRYGGRHHVCSIGSDDERDEVVIRFAVVRRDRFVINRSRDGGARTSHKPG